MYIQNTMIEKVIQHLIIYSASLDNIDLMNGKMGIALFFYHLHTVTKNNNHLIFANALIEEIISKLNYKIPRTFFDGLVGISWGFDHIIRNKFVDFEDEDILSDIDKAILEINVSNLFDESFSTGIRGIAYYLVSRCSAKVNIPIPFCKEYIYELYKRINRIEQKESTAINLQHQLQQIINGDNIEYDLNPFYFLIGNEPFDDVDLFTPNRNIGIINNGYTGIAFRMLKNMEIT